MKKILTNDLKISEPLEEPLLHESGDFLLNKGEQIDAPTVEFLRECEIFALYQLETGDSLSEYRARMLNYQVPLTQMQVGEKLTRPVYDDHGKLLVDAGAICTESLLGGFRRRGVEAIYFRRSDSEIKKWQVRKFLDLHTRHIHNKLKKETITEIKMEPEREIIDTKTITPKQLDQNLEEEITNVLPAGLPLAEEVQQVNVLEKRTEDDKQFFSNTHKDFIDATRQILTALERNERVNIQSVGKMVHNAIRALLTDRDLLLNLTNLKSSMEDYYVTHSINVTIIAINIGTALGYNKEQIYELALGAFLHDVGMLKIPVAIRLKPHKLTLLEEIEMKKHTIYGIEMLHRMDRLPISTPYIAYQSHERDNGKGYPKGHKGYVIHKFAKIVGVADVYDAMTTDRPYRSAKLPYEAMETIVMMGGKKFFDTEIVRAFLKYHSLFPIGSFVQLNSGDIGRVVAANVAVFTKPVIAMVIGAKGERLSNERVNLAESTKLKIVKAIDGSNLNLQVMDGF